jgi:hypothetical protein
MSREKWPVRKMADPETIEEERVRRIQRRPDKRRRPAALSGRLAFPFLLSQKLLFQKDQQFGVCTGKNQKLTGGLTSRG